MTFIQKTKCNRCGFEVEGSVYSHENWARINQTLMGEKLNLVGVHWDLCSQCISSLGLFGKAFWDHTAPSPQLEMEMLASKYAELQQDYAALKKALAECQEHNDELGMAKEYPGLLG